MTDGGRLVIIRGRKCRALLEDKGKLISHRGQGHAQGQAQSKDT